jgi:glycosyltransferase involved in cell wall biosynthesis
MEARKLRIAQVGAIWEKTPPNLYGGTERIVSELTEGLVGRGHDVTLFATGDSVTKANLQSITEHPLYRSGIPWTNITYPTLHIYKAFQQASNFDIMHFHLNVESDFIALAFANLLKIPSVFTLHLELLGNVPSSKYRLDLLTEFKESNYISISDSQRTIKELNYQATIYNGIPLEKYQLNEQGGEAAVWLGRFLPIKGPLEAMQVAVKLGIGLKMAGKYEKDSPFAKSYYESNIEPLLTKYKEQISYIGEVNDQQKNQFLGNAKCLINPINWDEPFGLVVAEANATGTPVVAYNRGSMSEIIKEGVNGYLVKAGDINALTSKVKAVYSMPNEEYHRLRQSTRKYAGDNFSAQLMVENYERIYQKIIKK